MFDRRTMLVSGVTLMIAGCFASRRAMAHSSAVADLQAIERHANGRL